MPRTRMQRPVEYRDRQSGVWYVSEVAQLKVVSPAIDGPNLCLVIRFEREGEERFAQWIGGDDWRERGALHRLFAEAEPGEPAADSQPVAIPATTGDTGIGPAPPETVRLWVERVKTMGPDEGDDFERRTFAPWDIASLGDLRREIERRRRRPGAPARGSRCCLRDGGPPQLRHPIRYESQLTRGDARPRPHDDKKAGSVRSPRADVRRPTSGVTSVSRA